MFEKLITNTFSAKDSNVFVTLSMLTIKISVTCKYKSHSRGLTMSVVNGYEAYRTELSAWVRVVCRSGKKVVLTLSGPPISDDSICISVIFPVLMLVTYSVTTLKVETLHIHVAFKGNSYKV